jgi:hypothetical protein
MTRDKVVEALRQSGSDVQVAAESLDVHPVSLYRFMREQGIRIENKRHVIAPSG